MPLEYYSLRKVDFYEYIDDVVRKHFIQYLKMYPGDEDLRRFYYEQINWMSYRHLIKRERLPTPVQVKRDTRRMTEIKREDREIRERETAVILPKIDKKQQNRSRIIQWNKIKNQTEIYTNKDNT